MTKIYSVNPLENTDYIQSNYTASAHWFTLVKLMSLRWITVQVTKIYSVNPLENKDYIHSKYTASTQNTSKTKGLHWIIV